MLCPQTDYQCNDRITCIDRQWLCDGGKDCPGGDDEELIHCQNKTCRDDQFQCMDHTCIPGHLMCSGKPECPDGSDELNCSTFRLKAAQVFIIPTQKKNGAKNEMWRINSFISHSVVGLSLLSGTVQPFHLENATEPKNLIAAAVCAYQTSKSVMAESIVRTVKMSQRIRAM